MLYSGFNILPRSVFWSANFNGRSDNTDVITLKLDWVILETKPPNNTNQNDASYSWMPFASAAMLILGGMLPGGPPSAVGIVLGSAWFSFGMYLAYVSLDKHRNRHWQLASWVVLACYIVLLIFAICFADWRSILKFWSASQ